MTVNCQVWFHLPGPGNKKLYKEVEFQNMPQKDCYFLYQDGWALASVQDIYFAKNYTEIVPHLKAFSPDEISKLVILRWELR